MATLDMNWFLIQTSKLRLGICSKWKNLPRVTTIRDIIERPMNISTVPKKRRNQVRVVL